MLVQRFSTCLITLMIVGLAHVPSPPDPIVPVANLDLLDQTSASFHLAKTDYSRIIDMGRKRSGSGHRPRIS